MPSCRVSVYSLATQPENPPPHPCPLRPQGPTPEVVLVLFLAGPDQRTIPRQMFSGLREQINPTILAVATLLILVSICLLITIELLRRRSERLRSR